MRLDVRLVPAGAIPAGATRTGWPEGWPVPRVGELIEDGGHTYDVVNVTYYPAGAPINDDSAPFVYVVAHRRGV
jgi:hypothetical protein